MVGCRGWGSCGGRIGNARGWIGFDSKWDWTVGVLDEYDPRREANPSRTKKPAAFTCGGDGSGAWAACQLGLDVRGVSVGGLGLGERASHGLDPHGPTGE